MRNQRPNFHSHPHVNRRTAIQVGGIGLLGLGMNHVNGLRGMAAPNELPKEALRGHKSVIYIFLSGGLTQHESFDPKPHAPDNIRGEFSPIATNTPGIQITEHLPMLAACSDKWSILRSLTHPFNEHSIGHHVMMTGRSDTPRGFNSSKPTANDHPSIASVVTGVVPRKNNLPPAAVLPEKLIHKTGRTIPGQFGGQMGPKQDPWFIEASSYKDTRNGLDGMDYSTKFSPWLANGSLSVRQLVHSLRNYERSVGANDSTYWIYFELLWREYYQFYAHRHGKRLFDLSGIKTSKPATSFYPERFQKWCHGNTPYPIVNACMKQLNSSGYMSNRGRQLVASCFVHELGLNWRYGAAYMEQQLIDHDVASNWGNWQYLAGVGADPRGHRRFDLIKQGQIYDPKGSFIKHWGGDQYDAALDSVDAADWPISR